MHPLANTPVRKGIAGWLRLVRPRQILAAPLWVLSASLLVLADYFYHFTPIDNANGPIFFQAIGVLVMIFAARLGASTPAQLAALDDETRPVIYLRSFTADKTPFTVASDEEILVRIFGSLGPFLAIAEPDEMLPDIGAAKIEASHDTWQQVVTEQISNAQAVVLHVGTTPGFLWEVQHVAKLCPPEKILLYFSIYLSDKDLKAQYAEFTDNSKDIFPIPLPRDPDPAYRIISFGEDWTPHGSTIATPSRWWRFWLGLVTLGIGTIATRPITTALYRRRVGKALAGFYDRRGWPRIQHSRFNQIAVVAGTFVGGFLAMLPMLALNFWVQNKRLLALACCCAILPALSALGRDLSTHTATVVAFALYLVWPWIVPRDLRRDMQFGGRVYGFWVWLAICVTAGYGVHLALPEQGLHVEAAERDKLRVFTPAAYHELAGLDGAPPPLDDGFTKIVGLSGNVTITYEGERDYYLYSTYSRAPSAVTKSVKFLFHTATSAVFDLTLQIEKPFVDPRHAAAEPDPWTTETYLLTDNGATAGQLFIAMRTGELIITQTDLIWEDPESLLWLHEHLMIEQPAPDGFWETVLP